MTAVVSMASQVPLVDYLVLVDRQIEGAKVGLAHVIGPGWTGHTTNATYRSGAARFVP